MHTKLYNVTQIRQLESAAIKNGLGESTLMDRAGKAAFECLVQNFPETQKITVCTGPGNNGGDGYVIAKCAHEAGLTVDIVAMCDPSTLKGAAHEKAVEAKEAGISIILFEDFERFDCDLIVDALLGIGIKESLKDNYKAMVEHINDSFINVIAVDIPTGIDANTGAILTDAVNALVTITFIGHKIGLHTSNALDHVGSVLCDELDLDIELFEKVECIGTLLQEEDLAYKLLPRPVTSHKGDFGHVLVIGGAPGTAGAVRLAAEAAYRTGCGLCSVATDKNHVNTITSNRPEIMAHAIENENSLSPLLEKASVVVLGPGLSQSEIALKWWERTVSTSLPKVIDADGLNILASSSLHNDNWILTPHPKEASRLLDKTVDEIQKDRISAVLEIQKRYGGVVVLKGAGSIISNGKDISVCPFGNPGMATAGMGDVLSGIIASFISQGHDLLDAAKLGVLSHAIAGDMISENGERGMIASDLFSVLPEVVNPYLVF